MKLFYKPIVILSALAVIFFFIYSFLNFGNYTHFTWPDETANYFFVNNYIKNSNFSITDQLDEIAPGLVRPRSFNAYEGKLVPGSFLGLLLIYGLVGKIIGIGLVKYLTPLLAAIAGIFFYKILLKVFDPKIAFISTLLFYINPAWWYYANFAMLPNIAFLTFVLIGIYWLLKLDINLKNKNYLFVIAGAFFIGLALIIRTNEFLWILGLLAVLALFYRQKIKWQYLILFGLVCFLVFIPIFYYNQTTYGNFLSFGYLRLTNGDTLTSQLPTEFKTSASGWLNFVKFIFVPFGVNPNNIVISLYKYVIRLVWWLALMAIIGMFIFLKKYQAPKQAIYFLLMFGVSIYLGVYYGSWVFTDQLTLNLNKLGISYVRYFLPIYILILPMVAIFADNLKNLFKNKKLKIFSSIFLALIVIMFSINALFISGEDNLVKTKQYLDDYKTINRQVVEATEVNAVIISQRSDKIFFPERKVIGRWGADDIEYWGYITDSEIPVYYYAYESEEFINRLNDNLYNWGLELTAKKQITDKDSLYKIEWLPYDEEEFYDEEIK